MIEIIPSLSVIKGQCVRLLQGDYQAQTVYKDSPLDMALRFEEHGIRRLHLIDLEGAKDRQIVNRYVLELISGHTKLAIDFGGGINTDGDIIKAFEHGASMVAVGSVVTEKPDLFSSWIISYGRDKIILSVDFINDKVAARGRLLDTGISLFDHIETFYQKGVLYVKCADISKDGMMQGPAYDIYAEILKRFPKVRLLASGGISSIDDIKRLEDMGVYGAIIGKAFYEYRISLKEMERYIASASV